MAQVRGVYCLIYCVIYSVIYSAIYCLTFTLAKKSYVLNFDSYSYV
jgi:hypothetical protein